MPTFQVIVTRQTYETAVVEIEASTENDAEQKVQQILDTGPETLIWQLSNCPEDADIEDIILISTQDPDQEQNLPQSDRGFGNGKPLP